MEDCSTDERLQQETLCHRQWTDELVRLTSIEVVNKAERVTRISVMVTADDAPISDSLHNNHKGRSRSSE